MTMLDTVCQWLESYDNWEDVIFVDLTEAGTGNSGIFPQGVQELSRRTDVLGNITTRNRLSFRIIRVTRAPADQQAAWVLDFQNWVQQQSATGKAPVFGDVPGLEKLWAEKGRLKNVSQTGTARYEVRLVAEFTKIYEA